MSVLDRGIQEELLGVVGPERARFDRRERRAYSGDIGSMPAAIRPFMALGTAGGVVRPADAGQLRGVLAVARRHGLPVVPRAWATSGYGGALPVPGGLAIDLRSLDRVLSVDPDALTATVQAGAIWEVVERRLAKDGLALRLYPSSAPASSVGGWLAQGGSGFGSYEYGTFRDNAVSALVMLPDGTERAFEGEELRELVADMEGTTGIILEVTFRLRTLEPETHRLFSLADPASLAAALASLRESGVPLWSVTFLNPESTRVKHLLPEPVRHGHEAAVELPELPEAYLLLVAYPASREPLVATPLASAIASAGGQELSPAAAEHEWSLRFAPMRLKRVTPSLIPTEVVVPLAGLAATLDEIGEKVRQPFVLEGMAGSGDEVVLLGFIPHDERSLAFNAAFALSLTVLAIARRHGGRAYSTGAYFRTQAGDVLGADRVARARSFRESLDGGRLLNPRKVFGRGAIDLLMGTALVLEPLIRPVANAARPPEGPGNMDEVNGIPGDVAFMARACAKCGYCVPTCEQYWGRGWESQSPRGKYAFIRDVLAGREEWDRAAVDTMLVCTTCELCNDRCQLQLPVEHNWMTMRGKLINEEKRGTFPPFEMMAASLRDEGDIWAGKAEHRGDWVPADVAERIPEQSDILYFAGCTASFVETDIAEASMRLLQDAGHSVAYMGPDEQCCGIPMKMAGKWDLFEEIYEHNVAEARKRGAKTIVTSCPACALVWKEHYARLAADRGEEYEFEVKHYAELVAPALADGTIELKENPLEGHVVTFHDSCHAGRAQGLYEPPREMLAAIPGIEMVEMEHNREEGLCCGSVMTLVGEIPVAPVLGCGRLQEALDAGADTVVALCPCCQVQLRDSNIKGDLGLRIDDLSRVVAAAAGYDIPETTEYSMYMWGYFEKFIVLMEPENMARLMVRVFPQMLDAMPLGMGPAMVAMARVPGGLAVMGKAMPLVFPAMAPAIMGSVMPDLVSAVEDYVGEMPADMAELMPGLLPKTMESLMPTYLPELVPHLVPLFIDYLRTRSGQA